MQVENYIKDLLYRYDCVIVPNLGAFMVKFESSIINEQTNQLAPPKRTLVFNGQLKSEDVLLINYISQKENLVFEDAKVYLASYVEDLNKVLSIERKFQFKGLGKLQLTEENQLTFFPDANQNFHKASFGLSAFTLQKQITKPKENEIPVIELNEEAQEVDSLPWLKYVALLIVAFLAGAMGYYLVTNYTNEANQQQIAEKVEEKVQKEIQSANFFVHQTLPAIEIEVKNENEESSPSLRYHIIAGAFRNEENAFSKLNKLLDDGFEARYLGLNKYNLHQVAYSSYATRSEAITALSKIRKSHQNTAWLLVGEF